MLPGARFRPSMLILTPRSFNEPKIVAGESVTETGDFTFLGCPFSPRRASPK
jgi:hypothetical protein